LTLNDSEGFFKESDLAGALVNPDSEADVDGDEKSTVEPSEDYQLFQAVTVLKGIAILNAK